MKFWFALIAVLAVIFGVASTYADDGAPSCHKDGAKVAQSDDKAAGCSKSGEKVAGKCQMAKGECEVGGKKVQFDMPALIYKVGDKEFCCDKMASEAAKGDAKAIRYVVADKTYDEVNEAMSAYAKVLDSYLNDQFLTIQFAVGDESMACPVTAKTVAEKKGEKVRYRVASFTFDDKEQAEKALAKAKDAAGSAKTGSGAGCCMSGAKTVAKSDGKSDAKTEGTVASGEKADGGEKATCAKSGCCKEVAAKVDVAKAKITAAAKAVAEVKGA